METLHQRPGAKRGIRPLAKSLIEKTFYLAISVSKSLTLGLIRDWVSVESKTSSPKVFTLVQIDLPNQKSQKFHVNVSWITKRIDLKKLRSAGIPLASNLRETNRGNLLIPEGWPAGSTKPLEANPCAPNFGSFAEGTVRLMFQEGHAWTDTPEFHHLRQRLEKGKGLSKYSNFEELLAKGDRLRTLFETISDGNYRLSQEVSRPYWDEPHFYVDEHGALCGPGQHGNHRFEIARLLNLDTIPMVFGGVHVGFYRRCFEKLDGARDKFFGHLIEDPRLNIIE